MLIRDLWIELLPQFQNNFEIAYIFLDLMTVLILLRLFIDLPREILLRTGGKL